MNKLNALEKQNLQEIIEQLNRLCTEVHKNNRDVSIQVDLEKAFY